VPADHLDDQVGLEARRHHQPPGAVDGVQHAHQETVDVRHRRDGQPDLAARPRRPDELHGAHGIRHGAMGMHHPLGDAGGAAREQEDARVFQPRRRQRREGSRPQPRFAQELDQLGVGQRGGGAQGGVGRCRREHDPRLGDAQQRADLGRRVTRVDQRRRRPREQRAEVGDVQVDAVGQEDGDAPPAAATLDQRFGQAVGRAPHL
jgi:hypothetical protein